MKRLTDPVTLLTIGITLLFLSLFLSLFGCSALEKKNEVDAGIDAGIDAHVDLELRGAYLTFSSPQYTNASRMTCSVDTSERIFVQAPGWFVSETPDYFYLRRESWNTTYVPYYMVTFTVQAYKGPFETHRGWATWSLHTDPTIWCDIDFKVFIEPMYDEVSEESNLIVNTKTYTNDGKVHNRRIDMNLGKETVEENE